MTATPTDRAPTPRRELAHGPAGSSLGSVARIWDRIRHPVDVPAAVEALVGVPLNTTRQLVSATVAGSEEAGALLAAMPDLIRNLSISSIAVPERTVNEIRGPVMWSETLSARSASAGDPGVFVCATMARAYDTPENRILAGALAIVVRGGRDVERLRQRAGEEPPLFEVARRNADVALRFLDHRALTGVRRDKISRRAMARLQHDARRRGYRPVLDLLRLAAEPLDAVTIRQLCDPTTTAEHDLVVSAVDQLERRGIRLPEFLVAGHALVAGPLRYTNTAHPSADRPGLSIGSTRLVVPQDGTDLGDAMVVRGRADLIAAVDAAIAADSL